MPRPKKPARRAPITVADVEVPSGRKRWVEIPLPALPTGAPSSLQVQVTHGRADGPTVFVSAAVHGDELNGIQAVHRISGLLDPKTLKGTVLAVPVVNVYGVSQESRYLPDRRDLNRSFPGSRRGSLAARLAEAFVSEVVGRCSVGIDLHTGSDHRTNLPHLRADLDDPDLRRLAGRFGGPLIVSSRGATGTLRAGARTVGAKVLLFEGGEALRWDPTIGDAAVAGCLRVFDALGMLSCADHGVDPAVAAPVEAVKTSWRRAPRGGFFQLAVKPGDPVQARDLLGRVLDVRGQSRAVVRARRSGLVIGVQNNPLVYQGDALVHVAYTAPPSGESSS